MTCLPGLLDQRFLKTLALAFTWMLVVRAALILQSGVLPSLFATVANPIEQAIARAHQTGNELHVWTVNLTGDMARFADMGVDNIITDRPQVLAELLEHRTTLSDSELLVLKIRSWLR